MVRAALDKVPALNPIRSTTLVMGCGFRAVVRFNIARVVAVALGTRLPAGRRSSRR
ncbi:hypothetical protein ABLN85_04545 [Mycobacterium tuberculosis]